MRRTLLLLALGVLLGYQLGFNDARRHDRPVYDRALDRVGSGVKGKYSNDVDGEAAQADP